MFNSGFGFEILLLLLLLLLPLFDGFAIVWNCSDDEEEVFFDDLDVVGFSCSERGSLILSPTNISSVVVFLSSICICIF